MQCNNTSNDDVIQAGNLMLTMVLGASSAVFLQTLVIICAMSEDCGHLIIIN